MLAPKLKSLQSRIGQMANGEQPYCSIPGCGRPTAAASGKGLAQFHCRLHVQFKARHGSHWCPTYKASDLKPYVAAASSWLQANQADPAVSFALASVAMLLPTSGYGERAQDLKRKPAAYRAKVAFARLRDAGISPERIVAIYLGIAALIQDDRGSHRVSEFLVVQVAKAAHRLASGTHRRWDFPMANGTTHPVEMHVYPKSSGLVLRVIGGQIDEACRELAEAALPSIITAKTERYGPHESHLPRWKPLWQRQREAVR